MYVQDPKVETVSEQYLYDFNNLLADAGGYLGLLMGASLLTFYEVAADLMEKIVQKFCGQNK